MIDLSIFGIPKITGVLHLGSHSGQELEYYKWMGINTRIWVDPFHEVAGEKCLQYAVGSHKPHLYIASNNGESSSFLKPKMHLAKYPEVTFKQVETWRLKWTKVTTIIALHVPTEVNLMVLDLQGMELEALRTCSKFYFNVFDYIVTEAYTEELYEGNGYLHEIEEYLKDHYKLVKFIPEADKGWGYAYFERIK